MYTGTILRFHTVRNLFKMPKSVYILESFIFKFDLLHFPKPYPLKPKLQKVLNRFVTV